MKYLAALLLLLAASGHSSAKPTWVVGNSFNGVLHAWAKLRNVRVNSPGTISAPEMIEWQAVKSAWRQLEKQVDAEYRY